MSTPPVVKAVMRIIGGATVGSLVAVGGYGVATAFAHTERTERTTVPADGLSAVVVQTELGDIEVVEAASRADVELTTRRRGNWRVPDIDQRREGDRLLVEGLCDQAWWGDCSTDVVLRVPRGLTVQARSDVGDITARGRFTELLMESSAGDVRGERLHADSVTATTSVGDVRLELGAPVERVDASSGVGDIRVVVPDDGTAYAVRVQSDVGDPRTEVPLDSDSRYSIRAASSVGDVRVLLADGAP